MLFPFIWTVKVGPVTLIKRACTARIVSDGKTWSIADLTICDADTLAGLEFLSAPFAVLDPSDDLYHMVHAYLLQHHSAEIEQNLSARQVAA